MLAGVTFFSIPDVVDAAVIGFLVGCVGGFALSVCILVGRLDPHAAQPSQTA